MAGHRRRRPPCETWTDDTCIETRGHADAGRLPHRHVLLVRQGPWVARLRRARKPRLHVQVTESGGPPVAGLGDEYAASGSAHQYNAPHGTVNVHHNITKPLLRPWMAPPPAPGLVARPALSDRLLGLVTGDVDGPVGLSGVHGTGGFGKTTLANWVSHQPATRERFPGGLLWVTLGEQVTGPELAGRVNDLVEHLTGSRPAFTDPSQAGFRLGTLLDSTSEPILLIIDDVWTDAQLDPFLTGGARCGRLVPTRPRGLLPAATSVEVDRMTADEATALLLRDLPAGVTPGVVQKILAGTGRWPVLLG